MYDYCRADDLTIAPTNTQTFHVSKEEAIQDFRPHGYNCSTKSLEPLGHQSWDVVNFTYYRRYIPADATTNVTANYADELEFYYNNTATDNDWPRNTGYRQCMYISDELDHEFDGIKPLDCMISFEPFRLGFKFDNKTSTLGLNQAWTCDGIDGSHT